MIRSSMAAVLLAATALTAAAEPPRAEQKGATSVAAPTTTASAERFAKMRQAMLSQVAVYDAGEGAMRAPSAAEAAALASPATTMARAARMVALPGGGMALRADSESLSFLVVEINADGKTAIRHDASKSKAPAAPGGSHVR